jgi:hypothetical protein
MNGRQAKPEGAQSLVRYTPNSWCGFLLVYPLLPSTPPFEERTAS